MSNKVRLASLVFCALLMSAPAVYAQGGVKSGPDPSTIRDPDLEKDSLHNLEVARNYFKLKKAYVAALRRCEEIIAGDPNFSNIQEVLLIAGRSSLSLADSKGKQSPSLYSKTTTPEQFRDMGRDYLTKLVKDYPDSAFAKDAQDALRALEAVKP
jgi:outer membrane protein assembly factor BamD (BamD/ComL family)